MKGTTRLLGNMFRIYGFWAVIITMSIGIRVSPGEEATELIGSFSKPGAGGVRWIDVLEGARTVAIGSKDGVVRLWSFSAPTPHQELKSKHGSVVSLVANSKRQWLAATYKSGMLCIWDLKGAKPLVQLADDRFAQSRLIAGPDADTVVSFGADKLVRILQVATGKEVFRLDGHTAIVTSAALMHDNSILVTGDLRGEIFVWNVPDGKVLGKFSFNEHGVESIAFKPKSSLVAICGGANEIRIWDIAAKKLVSSFEKFDGERYTAVTWSDDGKRIYSTESFGYVGAWDARSGKRLFEFMPHLGGVTGIAVLRNGAEIVTSGGNVDDRGATVEGEVKVWRIKSK